MYADMLQLHEEVERNIIHDGDFPTQENSQCNRKPNLNHKKSLMFQYSRIQRKVLPQLVCGSRGAYLDGMLPGVQVTIGLHWDFFCVQVI